MFYSYEICQRKHGRFAMVWLAALSSKSVRKEVLRDAKKVNLTFIIAELNRYLTGAVPSRSHRSSVRFSLYLSATLMIGVVKIYQIQQDDLLATLLRIRSECNQYTAQKAIDLPAENRQRARSLLVDRDFDVREMLLFETRLATDNYITSGDVGSVAIQSSGFFNPASSQMVCEVPDADAETGNQSSFAALRGAAACDLGALVGVDPQDMRNTARINDITMRDRPFKDYQDIRRQDMDAFGDEETGGMRDVPPVVTDLFIEADAANFEVQAPEKSAATEPESPLTKRSRTDDWQTTRRGEDVSVTLGVAGFQQVGAPSPLVPMETFELLARTEAQELQVLQNVEGCKAKTTTKRKIKRVKRVKHFDSKITLPSEELKRRLREPEARLDTLCAPRQRLAEVRPSQVSADRLLNQGAMTMRKRCYAVDQRCRLQVLVDNAIHRSTGHFSLEKTIIEVVDASAEVTDVEALRRLTTGSSPQRLSEMNVSDIRKSRDALRVDELSILPAEIDRQSTPLSDRLRFEPLTDINLHQFLAENGNFADALTMGVPDVADDRIDEPYQPLNSSLLKMRSALRGTPRLRSSAARNLVDNYLQLLLQRDELDEQEPSASFSEAFSPSDWDEQVAAFSFYALLELASMGKLILSQQRVSAAEPILIRRQSTQFEVSIGEMDDDDAHLLD